MEYQHIPVMLEPVLSVLNPHPGENYLDCTMGGLGYTQAIAKKIKPGGIIISIDLDKLAQANAESIIEREHLNNIILVHDNFKNLSKIVKNNERTKNLQFNGVVYDLGLSSAQLKDRNRGFSFQLDNAPLDMGFGEDENRISTEDIINNWAETKIEEIFRLYGEESKSKLFAQAIVKFRKNKKIKTVGELVEIIKGISSPRLGGDRINPATKVFQALRIATNSELQNLADSLPQAVSLVKSGGKIAVVSYHSLEDRIVKNYFRQESRDCLCPPQFPICNCGHQASLLLKQKRATVPSMEEVRKNPRSRSAKFRYAIKK